MNSTTEKISFSFFLEMNNKKINTSAFSWQKYYSFLSSLPNSIQNKNKIEKEINTFFLCTDILDDLMDNDKPEIFNIFNLEKELSHLLWNNLKSIKNMSSPKNFSVFIDLISQSLIHQNEENQSVLEVIHREEDYYRKFVKRSTILLEALTALIHTHYSEPLRDSAHQFALFGQIKNDIDDLFKNVSSDIINRKPTLPLIIAMERLNKQKKEEFLYSINSATTDIEIYYPKIIDDIIRTESIEYCAKLSITHLKLSKQILIDNFPNKQNHISKFYDSIIKDDSND